MRVWLPGLADEISTKALFALPLAQPTGADDMKRSDWSCRLPGSASKLE